ncbi:MAG: cell division protein ZapA [Pseudomonadota bacterium]|jgi:cell division protein ZapA (FtsZ GTPase activity inhibitor)
MSAVRALPVDITIGGRIYRFAAPAEQLEHLQKLAARVDALFAETRSSEPNADRDRLMVLCCLTMASDLAEADGRLDEQASAVTQFHRQLTDKLSALLPAR